MPPAAGDTLDRLILFLAKRDGIDKLVKTIQYTSKLLHHLSHTTNPSLSGRAKLCETSAGTSRKAFRLGRFLAGFNSLRRPSPGGPAALHILANAGEMVYFFFDHFLWLARAGVLHSSLSRRLSFVSAFGEAFGYVFFIMIDLMGMRKEEMKGKEMVMKVMGIMANVADLVIAIADIEPNPFCNHAVTLGISGLVSAWAGWYRNWPA